MNKGKKSILVSILIMAVMSLALGVLFSYGRVAKAYAFSSDSIDIKGDDFISENVEFDKDTGSYIPTAFDAWIMFQGYNDEFSGVIVELEDKVSTTTPVMLYYSRMGEDVLSESHTVVSKIDEGQSTCFLEFPDTPVNIVRVDLDIECTIKSISLSKENPEISYFVESDFYIAVIIRAIIIFVVLFFAYLSHKERISKGGHPVRGIFVNENALGSDHKYEYDYLRTLAAFCVIAEHSVCEAYTPNVSIGTPGYGTLRIILTLSLVCNVLYVMLSGALLLAPKEESLKDFYIKRMGKVLIPTISYFLLYVLVGYEKEAFSDGVDSGALKIFKGLIEGRSEYMPHMWLVYVIIGLYIFAPFLRIIVSKITEGQLFGLVIAGFIFNTFSTYLPIFGYNFGIDTPVAGWIGVFLLGYYMTTEHARKRYWMFILLGVVGLITTFLMVYYRYDLLYYTSNWTPNMWLIGAMVFALFLKFKKIFGRPSVIIASVSKYNFSIMLIHVFLLLKIVLPFGWSFEADFGHLTICIVGMILGCFVLSYAVALLYDNTAIAAANYVYDRIFKKRK